MIILSYQFCIKTLFFSMFRNKYIKSGNESHLRNQIFFKNSWRVTMYKVRFTKLKLHTYLLLNNDSIICNESFRLWFSTRMYRESLMTNWKTCHQQCYVKQQPKYINDGILRTMGYPKRWKPYGSGDFVRESDFKRFSSITNINERSCVSLNELIKLNKNNKEYTNYKLIHIVSNLKVLILSYENNKNKSKSCFLSGDSFLLDTINLKWFVTVSQELKAGMFKFKPTKKSITKILTIDSFREKIVQQAIYIILNSIYDSSFLNSSHDFYLYKNTYKILKEIKYKFQDVKWCLKINIDYNFFSFDSKILLNLLGKRIVCFKFLALIKEFFKTGYEIPWKFVSFNKSFSQRNVCSIFSNIYLYELEVFLIKLSRFFNQNRCYKKFFVFRHARYQIKEKVANVFLSIKLSNLHWKIYNNNSFILNFKKFYHIRYVTSFIIGIVGSRKDIIKIYHKIEMFMINELQFPLGSQTISVIHFSKNPLFFVGIFIKKNWRRDKWFQITKEKNKISMKIKMTPKISLNASIKLIFKKATFHGFFKNREDKFIPVRVAPCINLNHLNILRYYNFVIYVVSNYYSFVDNKNFLLSFVHGLNLSCARTLALKYKLCHASKIYKKFGINLRSFDSNIELFILPTFKKIKEPEYKVVVLDNL